MKQKIYTNKDNLIIEIPLKTERCNPYMVEMEEYADEMDNIIALIENENNMGFCYRIDMSYKGKDDQYTDYFFKWFGQQKKFEEVCKKLNIDIIIK